MASYKKHLPKSNSHATNVSALSSSVRKSILGTNSCCVPNHNKTSRSPSRKQCCCTLTLYFTSCCGCRGSRCGSVKQQAITRMCCRLCRLVRNLSDLRMRLRLAGMRRLGSSCGRRLRAISRSRRGCSGQRDKVIRQHY